MLNGKSKIRKLSFLLILSMFISCIQIQAGSVFAQDAFVGEGVLNDWVNMGLNPNMTGGTAGRVEAGETVYLYSRHLMSSGRYCWYVYSERLNTTGYISEKYMDIYMYTETYAENIAQIAETEYQTNGRKHISAQNNKYNGYTSAAWCVSFVCWCAKTAGVPNSIIPYNQVNCTALKEAIGNDRYHSAADVRAGKYTPQKGDIICYLWKNNTDGRLDHVGLVVNVDTANYTVTTIEGNTTTYNESGVLISSSTVNKKTRTYAGTGAYSEIAGFINPNY